jgi:serine/threonine-protein kinase
MKATAGKPFVCACSPPGGVVSQPFNLQPGEQPFPGYCLHLPLGRGGCGEVWEARGPDGNPIALKFMRCKNTASATKEVRSLQALSRLYHPNLLRVYQVFLQSGFVVVAMELADGSLLDLLDVYAAEQGTAIQPELVCRYLGQAADVLDFLHEPRHAYDGRRVAFQHCDVKPSNILLTGDRVKLADFGLAAPMTASLEPHGRAGTLDFAAPEVFRGQLSDRTDQYALAVTYCLLRGGRLPFRDSPARFTPTYLRSQPDLTMLSPPERPIVAKALSVSPIGRWPSCGALMAELRSLFNPVRHKGGKFVG